MRALTSLRGLEVPGSNGPRGRWAKRSLIQLRACPSGSRSCHDPPGEQYNLNEEDLGRCAPQIPRTETRLHWSGPPGPMEASFRTRNLRRASPEVLLIEIVLLTWRVVTTPRSTGACAELDQRSFCPSPARSVRARNLQTPQRCQGAHMPDLWSPRRVSR